jgi:hypothetical protein
VEPRIALGRVRDGGSEVAEVHGPLQYLARCGANALPAGRMAGAVVLARVSREDFVRA